MQGTGGATDGPREAIVLVDEQMAQRGLRAARRHVLRRPRTWAAATAAVALLWLPTVLAGLGGAGPHDGVLASTLAVLVCVTALCPVVVVAMVRLSVGAEVAHDLAPGQLVGVVVGPRTLRVRGHHSSHEVSYALIRSIEQVEGIVIVSMTGRYWLLPVELFDTASLQALRQRAGTRPGLGSLLVA